jgi:hypothetical protein
MDFFIDKCLSIVSGGLGCVERVRAQQLAEGAAEGFGIWSFIFHFFVGEDEKKIEIILSFEELDIINVIRILKNILIFHSSFQKRLIIRRQHKIQISALDI